MKMTNIQIERIARKILDEMKTQGVIEYKEDEGKVLRRATEIIKADFDRELQLDRDVNKMLDDLERQNTGEFQRFKMFPMLKKRMAKEKGIIL